MDKEPNARFLGRACFMAQYGRNHAGYTANVVLLARDAPIELSRPARRISDGMRFQDGRYSSSTVACLLTEDFSMVLFGAGEDLQQLAEQWYHSLPRLDERLLFSLSGQHHSIPRNRRPTFYDYLATMRQQVCLAHLLRFTPEELNRFNVRAQAYRDARNLSRADYEHNIVRAEAAAERAAEQLREARDHVERETQVIATLEQQHAESAAAQQILNARTKHHVPSLAEDFRADIDRRKNSREQWTQLVKTSQRELAYQQERVQTLKEFRPKEPQP